jgi:RimJ/RimL family protein N-acetyltransferase
MDPATPALETRRLQLREVVLADAPFLLALLNDPAWLENIGDRGVRSQADAERYIGTHIRAHYQAHGYGMYAVQPKTAARPIGICGLVKRDFLPAPDLGVALLPEWAGRGYASECSRAVMVHAASVLGISQLYAIVKRENLRSVRLLERLGFRHTRPCSTPDGVELELYATQLQLSA